MYYLLYILYPVLLFLLNLFANQMKKRIILTFQHCVSFIKSEV